MANGDNTKKLPEGLKPAWEKGQSGNPGGRPKAVRDVAAAAREHTAEAIKVLVDALKSKSAPWNAKIRAAEVLLNRGYGQAPQTINLHGNVAAMDNEQLDRAVALGIAEYLGGRHSIGSAGVAGGETPAPNPGKSDGVVH